MTHLFLSDEDFSRCSGDGSLVADKADAFIRDLYKELNTLRAQSDAASITAEQTCSLLEQKYLSLSSEFSNLESQNAQLQSSLDHRLAELADVHAQKHQLHLQSIGKDGEIERVKTELSELHQSRRHLLELVEHKDLEISEKNATIKSYLDKIVSLTERAAQKDARLNDIETGLAQSQAACARLSQEKELIERHNVWLNDELAAKVDVLIELRRTHNDLEADLSSKLADVERQFNECSSSLKWYKERVRELEMKLTTLQEELCSSKEAASANEERLSAELSTVNKLVELYKESSEEWSRKAGELEGVIKALEMHLSQVENDCKEKIEMEIAARKQFEKEAADLKEKLEKCEADIETNRKANELNLLPLSSFTTETWMHSLEINEMVEDNRMIVPRIPVGVSGTALAASLLRDGWSLAKMYAKYQEAVDALRHEQLGRKESEAILQRVLYELEEKAETILDERVEHKRMTEAYSLINQKLQHSMSEQENLTRNIQELKVDLRRHERDYSLAQKEIVDLQKQVTVLLKECRDIQLRGAPIGQDDAEEGPVANIELNSESDADKVISERLLTFKDINGLVEQNVQLRSLVRNLSDQIENKEREFKENFEMNLKKHTDDAASKVAAVLQRAEEQGRMIESLHTSVAMYKRLYEEEHKLHSSYPHVVDAAPEHGRKDLVLLLEGSQDSNKKAQEQAAERLRCLEEDLAKARSEIISFRSERDKLALEANFARERLERFMKESEHQRDEINGVLARNVEFSQLIVDYQRKLRESSETCNASEELSRKSTMEVSILKREKELLSNAERRACEEVRNLSERVHRLQASLDTIQSAEEVREEARIAERRKQEEYVKQVEREWAEVKKQLQEERDNVRTLTLDREQTLKNAMRQVEEMGKELANALHAVTAAETRAAVAEARYTDLEKKNRSSDAKVVEVGGGSGPSIFSNSEVSEFHNAKEEMEKFKEEARAYKDHMLQYKSIAQVNEAALKQMESAHEEFKIEADKLKKSLENELLSLRERVSELEKESSLKAEEVSAACTGKEEALLSALEEITNLKEEIAVKTSQFVQMEIQNSALKEDLEKEHERWRAAQGNYERQVVLQSETIQELTKTSQALALLQDEASKLRNLADALENENSELKAKWIVEKSMLEESKNEAQKNYDEINEQNKILHSRLQAIHIQLAEKDRKSAGISAVDSGPDALGDSALQNVINYLRRSKEIAEMEISLLKQEKLRLQSQLESALKAAENSQASLHTERANSRALLFTEEEIKSLQLQVREMNLLRESNMQLREENKHNFEECLKLREVTQKARVESENLESLLTERHIEMEACKKEIEIQKKEKDHLEKRIVELNDRCGNINKEDFDRLKDHVRQMEDKLGEKEAQIEDFRKRLSEKDDTISQLEVDLAKSRMELNEREKRMNEILRVEANLKSDVERQKKMLAQFKRRLENLTREKEELGRENQGLSKQLDEFKQGKRSLGDTTGEQAMKEKEEKDTKIQILEKHLERQREDLRKEKDDNKKEKERRQKSEKAIKDSFNNVEQEKTRFLSELEKHKQALKQLSNELEKLKHAKGCLPEGTSVVQILSGTVLDDLAVAYASAVESFERAAHSVFGELGASALTRDTSAVTDNSVAAASGPVVPSPASSIVTSLSPATSYLPPSKATGESLKRFTLPKSNSETRKTGRKLVRPRLLKPEEPLGDVEMSEVDGGKAASTQDTESQVNQPLVRKRLALSAPESHEDTHIEGETSSDVAAPVLKKSKGSDSSQNVTEGLSVTPVENLANLPVIGESYDDGELFQGSHEEAIDAEKEETETTGEKSDEPKDSQQVDDTSQVGLQNVASIVSEENVDKPSETDMAFDDNSKDQVEQDNLMPTMEFGSEKEEGELEPDVADVDGGGDMSNMMGSPETGDGQPETVTTPVASPARVDDDNLVASVVEAGEISPADALNDDKNDEVDVGEEIVEVSEKSNDGNDPIAVDTDQISEAAVAESTSMSATAESSITKQGSTVTAEEDAKRVSGASSISTLVNLQERARERAVLRQAGANMLSPPATRGRGRPALRGRGVRGRANRSGRGQAPGEQG